MRLIRLNHQWPEIEVLYEDDNLLAVNKPAGLLAVTDRWDKAKDNLVDLLQAAHTGQYFVSVQRLDKNISGVFLLAKVPDALGVVADQFCKCKITERYLAIVTGAGMRGDREEVVECPIGPHPRLVGLSQVDHKHGKPARSIVRVREQFYGYTLVEVEIESRRQHQVQVHCEAIGHSVVGDASYGGTPLLLSELKRRYKGKDDVTERPLLDRPAIHAATLILAEPEVTIAAPLPKDMEVALKYLRKFAV
jgi:RluA family pseudouridine synthase